MFTVCVRDHFMIAHSFRGAVFGPAQNLHGATYVVDVEFRRERLDANGIVVDIGRAAELVKKVLAELNFRNLDDAPKFTGRNTTTEFLAFAIFERLAETIADGGLGVESAPPSALKVTLHESHVAWAAYEGRIGG